MSENFATDINVGDTIYRKAAIDALFKWYEDEDDDRDAVDVICGLPSAQPETPCYLGSPCEYQNKDIKLPSAQPQHKCGKWIEVEPHMVICPFCKHASSRKNFCAECGADMRGGSE